MRALAHRSISLAMLLVAPVVAGGCTAATTSDEPDTPEVTSTTSQALLQTKPVAINTSAMSLVSNVVGLRKARLSVDGGTATFVMSPEMAALMASSGTPAPASMTFAIPETTIATGWYSPDLHVSVQHLHMLEDAEIEVVDDHIDLVTALAGSLHVRTAWPWPDGDYVVNRASVRARFVIGGGGALQVSAVDVGLDAHTENCGLFGWCSALVDALAPDLSPKVGTAARNALAGELAQARAQNTWFKFLDKYPNLLPDGGPAWVANRSTVAIAGGELSYQAQRRVPPAAPVCYTSVECDDKVVMHCSGSWITGAEVTTAAGKIYADAGWDYAWGMMKLTWGGTAVATEPTQTARVCTNDEDGTTCTNVVVSLPHNRCIKVAPIPRPPIPFPFRPF